MQDRFKFRLWDKSVSQMSYDVCEGWKWVKNKMEEIR